MQIVRLELDHFNFYCPVTGEVITCEDEPLNEDATSFLGCWTQEPLYEPIIKDRDLEHAWRNYVSSALERKEIDSEQDIDYLFVESFFETIDKLNSIVFELTVGGMTPHGSNFFTSYLVLNLGVH